MSFVQRLTLFGAALTFAGSAIAAPLVTFHATTRMQSTMPGKKPVVALSEIWIKNGRFRAKRGKTVQIINGKNQMFVFTDKDPKKRFIEVPAPPQLQARTTSEMLSTIVKLSLPPNPKKRKVGTASILGYPTTIYEVSMPKSTQKMRIWEATGIGAPVPLRVQMTGAGASYLNDTTSLELNKNLPDSLFVPPAGFKRVAIPRQPPLPPGMTPGRSPKH